MRHRLNANCPTWGQSRTRNFDGQGLLPVSTTASGPFQGHVLFSLQPTTQFHFIHLHLSLVVLPTFSGRVPLSNTNCGLSKNRPFSIHWLRSFSCRHQPQEGRAAREDRRRRDDQRWKWRRFDPRAPHSGRILRLGVGFLLVGRRGLGRRITRRVGFSTKKARIGVDSVSQRPWRQQRHVFRERYFARPGRGVLLLRTIYLAGGSLGRRTVWGISADSSYLPVSFFQQTATDVR